MSALSSRLESRMSSDLSRILQILQQPQGHTGYTLGTPASSDLALFPDISVTRSAEPRPLVEHPAQVRDKGIPRVSHPRPDLSMSVVRLETVSPAALPMIYITWWSSLDRVLAEP